MMKYKGIYLRLFSALLKKPMKQQYGRELTKKALKKAPDVYRDMLAKTDDIGEKNPMANNIYMGYVFMAIWKAADGAIDVCGFREVIKEFMHSPLVSKLMGGKDINRAKDMKSLTDTLHSMKDWADAHPQYNERTWDFNFDDTKHKDGIYYHFTRCPLEKFARENGFLEILPIACDMDYLTAESRHGVLRRDHTLATGGKICDYWIIPDQIKDPK